MADSDSIWYRLGYAFERSRTAPVPRRLHSLAEHGRQLTRLTRDESTTERGDDATSSEVTPAKEPTSMLLALGAGSLAARVLSLWSPRRQPGVAGLARGALAGAGAAYLRRVLTPILHGRLEIQGWDDNMADLLMEGVVRGLVYAALLDGRLPGAPLWRGVLYGVLEYISAPWGGLEGVLGRQAPHRRVPVVGDLLSDRGGDREERDLVDEVAFAVALALLYGNQGLPVLEDPTTE